MKVLFIHRSVGRNLLHDGGVRGLLKKYPDVQFDDYDQNIDQLTMADGSVGQCHFVFPDGDTTPASYAEIFSEHAIGKTAVIRDFVLQYDVIVIKSCYPNSNIKSEAELVEVKTYYRSIAKFFTIHPDKKLIILTSPPLAPMRTTKANAKRARRLAQWLATEDFGTNVHVFDFYDRLADSKHGWLKRIYRRWLPVDSHPNKRASREVALEFVRDIVVGANT